MNILAAILFGLALLMALWVRHAKGRTLAADRRYRDLEATNETRDRWLDWLMREYLLNLSDPFTDRPTVVSIKNGLPVVDSTERRCYHCNAPVDLKHQPTCPWVVIGPFRQKLYPGLTAAVPAAKSGLFGLSLTR